MIFAVQQTLVSAPADSSSISVYRNCSKVVNLKQLKIKSFFNQCSNYVQKVLETWVIRKFSEDGPFVFLFEQKCNLNLVFSW